MSPVTHFDQPLWLLAGAILVPLVMLLYWRFDRRQRRRVLAFSLTRATDSAFFGVSRPLLWTKRLLFCLGILAACVALARPLGSMQLQESERRGTDILFAIDTSRSMLTPDVKPDRLTRAKLAVEDLIDQLNGDGVGLVAFAGEAFLQAPVTTDYDAFRETLDSLDTHTIALGGTDLAAAIRLGESTLALRGDTQKVLVLITDGEDLAGDGVLAAQAAAKKGTIIFTVGVGTAAGELIPIPDGAGGSQFVKDAAGNFVKSHLDADTLTQIAAATGGVYTPLGPQGQGIVTLYQQRLKELAQHQHADRQVAVYAQLFQWPLALAIALLILEWLLGASVRRRVSVGVPAGAARALLLVLAVTVARAPQAWSSPRTAQEARTTRASFSRHSATTRKASRSIRPRPACSSIWAPRPTRLGISPPPRPPSTMRCGRRTCRCRKALITIWETPCSARGRRIVRNRRRRRRSSTWQQSLGAYDTALQMRPADADAKFNRGVVKQRLDELQRQQQQQQKNQNDQNNQHDQNKQQDQQPDKQQNGQQNPNGQPRQNGQQNQSGPQGQQNQPGQQNQQQDPQGQRNPQQNSPNSPQPQPGQSEQGNSQNPQGPQPAGPPPAGSGPQQPGTAAAQDIGKPDQMSRLEAEQLLDSTKGEERHLATGVRNGKPENAPPTPLKDW